MPEPPLALDAEWSVLLTACSAISPGGKNSRISSLLQSSLNWKLLLLRAEDHGILPLTYQALSEIKDRIPSEEMRLLQERYQSNIHKSLILTRELIRILEHLNSLAIEVLPHKGVTLAETVYGDMALRQSGDIDLLIRPRDVKCAKAALREIGYAPQLSLTPKEEDAYLVSGYESMFDGLLGRNLLELQWAPQPRFYAVDVAMDDFFQRAVTVNVGGWQTKTLAPNDLLLVLSVHAAKHVWGRLVWLCDIARLICSSALNWEWILNQAKALGIARILFVTLLLAEKLLETEIPATIQKESAQDGQANSLARVICQKILDGTASDVESLSYFQLMMRLRERRIDRIRFISRLALTPGPNEWKSVRLPVPLFPLYRLVRLSRLAARFARA